MGATFRAELWRVSFIIRYPTALATFVLWYPRGFCFSALSAEFTFVLRTTNTYPTVCYRLLIQRFKAEIIRLLIEFLLSQCQRL